MKRLRGLREDAANILGRERHHDPASRNHQFHGTPAELPAKLLRSLDRAVVGLNPFEKADDGPTTRDDPRGDRGPGQIGKRQKRGTSSEPGMIGHSGLLFRCVTAGITLG